MTVRWRNDILLSAILLGYWSRDASYWRHKTLKDNTTAGSIYHRTLVCCSRFACKKKKLLMSFGTTLVYQTKKYFRDNLNGITLFNTAYWKRRAYGNEHGHCYFHILKCCAKIKSIGWIIWHDRVPVPATTQFCYLTLKMASSEIS